MGEADTTENQDNRETVLDVRELQTYFYTDEGVVKAVDGLSYSVHKGEFVGLVGESGCGKSVSAMSVLRLIPHPPGLIVGGEILFKGEDLMQATEERMRNLRGNRIAMVFQEPTTSLNPVLTVGRQDIGVDRAASWHGQVLGTAGERRAAENGGDSGPGAPHQGTIRSSSAVGCSSG